MGHTREEPLRLPVLIGLCAQRDVLMGDLMARSTSPELKPVGKKEMRKWNFQNMC